ncbi:Quinate permease [Lachnellula arida]|uniref:Quinate permease n=1 Tax=Lachnellula arida TaxID=1316785 RepID=A0A8T9BIJ3_9HELO|nr:Quinate permease [Lachnellula arida]
MADLTTVQTTQTNPSVRFNRQQHINLYSLLVIGFITLSSAAYGYAGSVIATTLTQPSFTKHMKLDELPNAEALIGAMNALYYAGGVFGSFFAGWSSNKYGRKFSAALGNFLVLLSGALLTASVNPGMFIAFRFLSGFGVPLWVAELAPPSIRGILTDVHAVGMMVGYTLACYVGLGFYFVRGTNQWRGPIALQMAFPTIILCGLYWMPESPRFLLSKGRTDHAWKIIHRMHSNVNDPTDEFAKREFYQMRKQIELDVTFETSYLGIFKQPSLRKRALMTIFLEFCLMSSGVLVILNYGSIIWRSLGFDTVQILNFQGGFQLTGFVFNVVAMLFVDKIKRPTLIATGFIACAACMSIEAALQRYYIGTTDRNGLIACAFIIFLFQATFSMFLDGPTYFYIAEIWPSHVRSQGFALAMAILSVTNLMWLQAAPHAFTAIAWKFYLFFICIPILGAVVVFFTFKDTLHKPLEEIAAMFGDEDTVVVYQRELQLASVPLDLLDDAMTEKGETGGEIEEVENVPKAEHSKTDAPRTEAPKSWAELSHNQLYTG